MPTVALGACIRIHTFDETSDLPNVEAMTITNGFQRLGSGRTGTNRITTTRAKVTHPIDEFVEMTVALGRTLTRHEDLDYEQRHEMISACGRMMVGLPPSLAIDVSRLIDELMEIDFSRLDEDLSEDEREELVSLSVELNAIGQMLIAASGATL